MAGDPPPFSVCIQVKTVHSLEKAQPLKLCKLLACIYINAEHFSLPHKEKVERQELFRQRSCLTYEVVTAGSSLGPVDFDQKCVCQKQRNFKVM